MFSVDMLCEINNTWSLIQIDLVMVNAITPSFKDSSYLVVDEAS